MRINVTRSSLPSFEEYCQEIKDMWDSHWLTNNGQKLLTLQNELQNRLESKHISLFSNGHLALEALLASMNLQGEVITTPFSFASTTHAIVRKGLTPVFCDIRESDYTLDPDKLESLITEKTCAILPVHVYGCICDTDKIAAIAKKHNLPVIYDAAHAFGVKKNEIPAARFGDAAMFSFHATKVFHTIEGGCVATQSDELNEKLALERNFGITGPDDVVTVGGNAKMNEFQAAMGICNLRHVDHDIQKRKVIHDRYFELLSGVSGLRLPPVQEHVKSNYAYFPVVFDGGKEVRDLLCAALEREDIYARKYFYPLITDFECYQDCPNFDSALVPVAKRISDSVVTLPLYPDLADGDVLRIAQIIRQVVTNV